MRLWRPLGLRELALVREAKMAAFPPRLPEQPIFGSSVIVVEPG
jgi:hypothetical protein